MKNNNKNDEHGDVTDDERYTFKPHCLNLSYIKLNLYFIMCEFISNFNGGITDSIALTDCE